LWDTKNNEITFRSTLTKEVDRCLILTGLQVGFDFASLAKYTHYCVIKGEGVAKETVDFFVV
jgi:hypothetical protein